MHAKSPRLLMSIRMMQYLISAAIFRYLIKVVGINHKAGCVQAYLKPINTHATHLDQIKAIKWPSETLNE